MIEFEVTYRSIWQPLTPNDLTEVAVFATPAQAAISCSVCHTSNPSSQGSCSLCGAALPATEPVVTVIHLEGTCP